MSNEQVAKKNALDRVQTIPIVSETLNQILSIIQRNGFAAAVYARLEQVAHTIYNSTQPIQQRLPIETANLYANKSLDILESKFPTVFKIHQKEVVEYARKPADDAIALFQSRLNGAQTTLSNVQDRLAGAVASVPRTPEDAQKTAGELLNELNKLKDSVSAQIKDLPSHVQTTAQPLLDSLNTGIHDISKELARKDESIATRAQNVLQYSRENALPVVAKTLEDIKGLVLSKKDEASEKVEDGKSYAAAVADHANEKVGEVQHSQSVPIN